MSRKNAVITNVHVIQNGPFAGRVYGCVDGVNRRLNEREIAAWESAVRWIGVAKGIRDVDHLNDLMAQFPDDQADAIVDYIRPYLSFSIDKAPPADADEDVAALERLHALPAPDEDTVAVTTSQDQS